MPTIGYQTAAVEIGIQYKKRLSVAVLYLGPWACWLRHIAAVCDRRLE